ncbi:MAG: hypothetical protein WB699_18210 [Bacteroidota bacterium]
MEKKVKRLAIADLLIGVLHLAGGISLMLFVGGAPFAFGDTARETFSGVMLSLAALLLLSSGILALIGWRMIITRTAKGRVIGLFAAFFLVIMIPFGTIVGSYGIWLLFQDNIEQLFPARS